MRSLHLLAFAAGLSLAAAACGGGDSTGTKTPPTADFTPSCTNFDCTFTNASTAGDGTITTYGWDFGDGTTATTKDATHTYTAAGDFTVKLTVTDDNGQSGTKSKTVTVGQGVGNDDPIAQFTFVCDKLACTFTDASEDPDGSISSWSWDFGDGTAAVTDQSPSHTFAAGGTYTVVLTVTDNQGATNSNSTDITVSPDNNAPSAEFSVNCNSLDCAFNSTNSTDSDGTIVSWSWDFGDGATSTDQNPSHSYAVSDLTTYTVTLVVTDDKGATSSFSKTFTVSPPATLTCGTTPDCTLHLNQAAVVTVTLTSRECTAHHNTFVITAPVVDTLFKDGCYEPPVGTVFTLNSGAKFSAGTELAAEVISGSLHQDIPPAVQVHGSYPSWELDFDDGEDAPADFNDLVITITATP